MNRLTVRLESDKTEDGATYEAVKLFIDGISLMSLVHDVELPPATREGRPRLAAAYSWPGRLESTRKTLTEGASYRVAILECTCGVPDCWPLLAYITVRDSRVTWSGFEQPYRRDAEASGVAWSYGNLGPFVFDREQYEREMHKIDWLPPA